MVVMERLCHHLVPWGPATVHAVCSCASAGLGAAFSFSARARDSQCESRVPSFGSDVCGLSQVWKKKGFPRKLGNAVFVQLESTLARRLWVIPESQKDVPTR